MHDAACLKTRYLYYDIMKEHNPERNWKLERIYIIVFPRESTHVSGCNWRHVVDDSEVLCISAYIHNNEWHLFHWKCLTSSVFLIASPPKCSGVGYSERVVKLSLKWEIAAHLWVIFAPNILKRHIVTNRVQVTFIFMCVSVWLGYVLLNSQSFEWSLLWRILSAAARCRRGGLLHIRLLTHRCFFLWFTVLHAPLWTTCHKSNHATGLTNISPYTIQHVICLPSQHNCIHLRVSAALWQKQSGL